MNAFYKGTPTKGFTTFVTKNKDKLKQILEQPVIEQTPQNNEEKNEQPQDTQQVKIATTATAGQKIKPTVFNASYDETWKPLIEQKLKEKAENKIARIKGPIILVEGDIGTGKTHIALDFVNVPGYNLGYRIIPRGYPVYVLCTDPTPLDEAERNYSDKLWSVDQNNNPNGIIIKKCYVTDPTTGYVDPLLSLALINEFLSALKSIEHGTIVIEDWTTYCGWVLYAYMVASGGSKSRGVSFNEWFKPEKPLSPTEYQYKERVIDAVLLSFQNDYSCNFVLVANLKEETINTGDSAYSYEKTGYKIADISKGTDRKVDIVVRLYREETGGKIYRKAKITKSRFEGKVVDTNNITINQPTAETLVKHLVSMYIKGGVTK